MIGRKVATFYLGLRKEVVSDKLHYLALLAVLMLAFFLMTYRLSELLGFWYDQGRDALVIWDLWHKGKLFLIGPMMGFTGMFRGPWYYWLIAPFYLLGGGDPLWPAYFLVILSIIALVVLYLIVKEVGGKNAGLLAVFIASISYYIVHAARWLSNPTPMLLISVVLIWFVFKYLENKDWTLPVIAFLIGMGLNFGAAGELFYIPAILAVVFLRRDKWPGRKFAILGVAAFIATFLPQIIFELRHPGVYATAVKKFLVDDGSFTLSFWEFFTTRLAFYYRLVATKFWTDGELLFAPFLVIVIYYLIKERKEILKNKKFTALLIFVLSPFLGAIFFRSNQGSIFGYYFTGYYLLFIALFSLVLVKLTKKIMGKLVLAVFLVLLIYQNTIALNYSFSVSLHGEETIAFTNQLAAIDWIYNDASGDEFNLDVYVPPVIPYAYDYLFLWQGTKRCGENLCGQVGHAPYGQIERLTTLLYTLYEVDPPHPERLDAWLERQKGIGEVEYEDRFGGIVVQRRQRL
jgi:4-amino-4-deoxy-L-arabinose transferase-like glycosyltransferase